MGVDAGVSGRASERLVLPVRDVLVGASVAILLGQPKVNDVDQIPLLPQAHQEVVRLHVTVDEVLGVNVLQSTYLGQTESVCMWIEAEGIYYTQTKHGAICKVQSWRVIGCVSYP